MSTTVYDKEIKFKEYSATIKDLQLAKQFNKSGLRLAKEIWQLYLGPGGLLPADYFMYRLYDDKKYSAENKRRFISDNLVDRVTSACSDRQWSILSDDKWICCNLLADAGFEVPQTLAVIDHTMRSFGKERKIESPAALKDFLTGLNTYPLFAKANSGLGSFGAFIINGVDGNHLALEQSDPMSFDELFEKRIGERSFLLQRCIENHAVIKSFSKYVATVRTVNLVRSDGIWTPFALLKIPSATSIADNYWRAGNLLANLDVETGVIKRVVRGKGIELEEIAEYPVAGKSLIGLALPHWQKLRAINEACAHLYAPLRYHSLDIAITPEGPQVVEVNYGGSFVLPQIGSGAGLLSDEVFAFFKSCGYKFRRRLDA